MFSSRFLRGSFKLSLVISYKKDVLDQFSLDRRFYSRNVVRFQILEGIGNVQIKTF